MERGDGKGKRRHNSTGTELERKKRLEGKGQALTRFALHFRLDPLWTPLLAFQRYQNSYSVRKMSF